MKRIILNDNYNLEVSGINYGPNESHMDLKCFLYKGASSIKPKNILSCIEKGVYGEPIENRLPLVMKIHEHLTYEIISGKSKATIKNRFYALRQFVRWIDKNNLEFNFTKVEESFTFWTQHRLINFQRKKDISRTTLYDIPRLVATVIDNVLERTTSVMWLSRIRKAKHYSDYNKEKLNAKLSTSSFSDLIISTCDYLTIDNTKSLGEMNVFLESGGIVKLGNNIFKNALQKKSTHLVNESGWYSAINIRIVMELLMFISQTGMNLKQAYMLRMDDFHYTSHSDGYKVRTYKNRRQGEVQFEIFSEYKGWIERYFTWRNYFFKIEKCELVFPFIDMSGCLRSTISAPQFQKVRTLCIEHTIEYTGPALLRSKRINWLMNREQRKYLKEEIGQHSLNVMHHHYSKPDSILARKQINNFYDGVEEYLKTPLQGRCNKKFPEKINRMDKQSPSPDCINSAGCLYCINHRDIESKDYVWSLLSYNYLKNIELVKLSSVDHTENRKLTLPLVDLINKISEKIELLSLISEVHLAWVKEAKIRIQEGYYHPYWEGFILLNENS